MVGGGTIEVVPHASPLVSLLLFARWRAISIEIDGDAAWFRWGVRAFSVTPGEHDVTVGMRWSGPRPSITVTVAANETVRLRYTPHPVRIVRDRLEIERLPHAQLMQR